MPLPLVELASNIIAAQASRTCLSPEEISEGLRAVIGVLQRLEAMETEMTSNSDIGSGSKISPRDSIQQQQVICLECHQAFQLLSGTHLALHGMTSRDYKLRYGLPMSQPLCAKSVSLTRREIAKKRGLGTKIVPSRQQVKPNTVRLRLVKPVRAKTSATLDP